MKITDFISECTAYDFKLMLEERGFLADEDAISEAHYIFEKDLVVPCFLELTMMEPLKVLMTYSMFAKLSAARFAIIWTHCRRLR